MAALAAFWPCLDNGFVSWDDPDMLLDNPHFRGLGWENLRWMFSNFDFHGLYHPVAWLSYALDWTFWGLEPGGYHLTSLLLHAACAWLVFRLALRLLPEGPRRLQGAVFASLLFAVHPLRTEAVAWASARRDLLACLFSLACLEAYAAGRLRAAFAFFTAGLLSKATVLTLPLVLVVLDAWPLRRALSWKLARQKLPFLALSAAAAVWTVIGHRLRWFMTPLEGYGWAARLAQSAYGLILAVRQTFFPWGFQAQYEAPVPFDPLQARFVLAGVVLIAAAAAAWRLRRTRPGLIAAGAAYVLGMAPTMGLLKAGSHLAGDRFSYLPGVALCLVLGAGYAELIERRPRSRPACAVLAAFWFVGLGAMSRLQAAAWADTPALWRATLAADPGNAWALSNMSAEALAQGRPEDAEALARRALARNPAFVSALGNLASAYAKLDRLQEAQEALEFSTALSPRQPQAWRHLGLVLARRGRAVEAKRALQEAAGLGDADASYNMALLLQGQPGETAAAYRDALAVNPSHAEAANNLGLMLAAQGESEEARALYRAALRARPSWAVAHYNFGNLEAASGRLEAAERLYRGALRLDPGYAAARFNLGNTLARQGRFREAAESYSELLSRSPGFPRARESLEAARRLSRRRP